MRHLDKRSLRSLSALSLVVALVCPALVCPRAARAQDSSADTGAARALGVDGLRLASAGKCGEAIDKLARSEALHHAVSVLEKLGECQLKVGKVVDATESLRRVVREQLPPDAPAAYVSAHGEAQRLLTEAAHKVAHVNIAVAAPSSAALWVKIDGVAMPTANLNTDRPIDPGDHVVEAGAPGFLSATSKLHSNEGGTNAVALTLTEDPSAAPPPVVVAPVPANANPPSSTVLPPPEPPPAKSHTVAYVALGVGAAGLIVGAASGIAALVDKGNLTSACHNDVCPQSSSSTLNGGQTAGTISTVGFIVGGVGVAAGVALYFIDFGGHKATGAEGAPSARLFVGPGSAGLAGHF